jgi:hypothetical protein
MREMGKGGCGDCVWVGPGGRACRWSHGAPHITTRGASKLEPFDGRRQRGAHEKFLGRSQRVSKRHDCVVGDVLFLLRAVHEKQSVAVSGQRWNVANGGISGMALFIRN